MHTDDEVGRITAATTDDPFAVLHRRRTGVWVTTAAAVALGMAVWGSNVAGAATTPIATASRTFPAGTAGSSGSSGPTAPAATRSSSRSTPTDGGGGTTD
jgi:hypothetical protein